MFGHHWQDELRVLERYERYWHRRMLDLMLADVNGSDMTWAFEGLKQTYFRRSRIVRHILDISLHGDTIPEFCE